MWAVIRNSHLFLKDFEDVESAPRHSKCNACTEIIGPELLVLKTGRQTHLKSQKHRDSVKELVRVWEQQAADAARRLLPIVAAQLQLPTQFGAGASNTENSMDVDRLPNHPLDDFVFEDGCFWDPQGQEVLFSARDPDVENQGSLRLRAQLEHNLASLESGAHPLLGFGSPSLEDSDSEDTDHDDPTISDMVAELQMLGLLICVSFHPC